MDPLPHARNHFVITTGFVATKVAEETALPVDDAVANAKHFAVDLLCKSDEREAAMELADLFINPSVSQSVARLPPRCVLASPARGGKFCVAK